MLRRDPDSLRGERSYPPPSPPPTTLQSNERSIRTSSGTSAYSAGNRGSRGTRISVGHVFVLYRDNGDSAESIAATYDLNLAHVLDALSYAYDHPDEMEDFEERQKLRTILRKNDMVYAGGHLIARRHLGRIALPPDTPVYSWETLPEELGP